jgi:hypothetical protein
MRGGRKRKVTIQTSPRPSDNPEPQHLGSFGNLRDDTSFALSGFVNLVSFNLSQPASEVSVPKEHNTRSVPGLPIEPELDQSRSCQFREDGQGQHHTR